jgi:hypothetical protein
MKLTFGDYSFLGIDDMSVGRCMSHYENLNEGEKKVKLMLNEVTFHEDVRWNGAVVPSTLNFKAGGR